MSLIDSVSVLVACRIEEKPVTASEIADASDVLVNDVINTYKEAKRRIPEIRVSSVGWRQHLDSMCESLSVDDSVNSTAHSIGDIGVDEGIYAGRKPTSYAAACLYASSEVADSEYHLTQREVSEVAGVGESTIRVIYKKLVSVHKDNERR